MMYILGFFIYDHLQMSLIRIQIFQMQIPPTKSLPWFTGTMIPANLLHGHVRCRVRQ